MEDKFSYTYSAQKNSEVEKIRSKYIDTPCTADSRMEELRRLDSSCERPGTAAGILIGVVGALILGAGLTLVLRSSQLVLGIAAGLLGLLLMAGALPVYRRITAIRRKKLAPEIIRLSAEIEQGNR